ncbi:MAG: hypothetical protein AAF092_08785 [Pseudomonadota bacterium]
MAYTAESDNAYGVPMNVLSGPDGLRCQDAVMRPVKAVIAVASALSAAVIWALPAGDSGLDTLALKAAVSVALLMVALGMARGARERTDRDVELDFVDSVARITSRAGRGRPEVDVIPFDALGGMELNDCSVELFARDGSILATVELDPATAASLR